MSFLAMTSSRTAPNILITGTPGVGKSSIAKAVAEKASITWFDVSKLAVERGLVEEFDEKYNCPVIDEDKVVDSLESEVANGGYILDFYGADMFPEDWIDVVFVIRTENKVLYDRLTARGYKDVKLEHNLEYEMFGMALEEAKQGYDTNIVHEIENNTPEQIEDTVNRICAWIDQWKADNS